MTADRAALVKFGFDTGDYMCRCADCGLQFQGAKRSWRCRPCADEAVKGRAHTDDKRAHSAFANSENASRAALVERVRDIIAGSGNCDRWCEGSVNPHCGCRDDANEAIKIIRAEVLEEAEDTVGEVGDCAEVGAYLAAIRALKEKA